jgi:hypothetical protein
VAELGLVRRMTRVLLAILLLLVFFGSAWSGEQPLHVTVQLLLITPEKFAGTRVDVTGYCHTSNDEIGLAVSKRADEASHECENTIWLDPAIWDPRYYPHRPPNVAPPDQIDFRTVRVIGTFRYQPDPILDRSVPYERRFRGFGSYRMWAREIADITYFQPVR